MLEASPVVIVGAGPAGLTLGLCLAQHRVHSVILEKEEEVTTDPRGVYLTGDAVRILHDLGLGADLADIGHVVEYINFHKTSICDKPFQVMDARSDALNQTLPNGILQIQPRLEQSLRRKIEKSRYCVLRTGCRVVSREETDPPIITYLKTDGSTHRIQSQWLIGADGKMGVVRKQFLEYSADIRQEEGAYRYSGTWVASNLKLRLPTPESHPEFPLWALGYIPEEVYDLFWPKGWHFCSPPGKATATGRFGPYGERLWRHEFRQDEWNDSLNAEQLLWEHLSEMITRDKDESGRLFHQRVQYPRDCIKILRCRPFRFVHKVVNKWFDESTILIGDAAHVFPPFAGQGIASGIRDAHQLSWRLALLLIEPRVSQARSRAILEAWARERRKSVDDAALMSLLNGKLCNDEPTFWTLGSLQIFNILSVVPILSSYINPQTVKEREGFSAVEQGFFLREYRGGSRMAQIVAESHHRGKILSDQMLHSGTSVLSLLVLGDSNHTKTLAEAEEAIRGANISPSIISASSILLFSPVPMQNPTKDSGGCIKPGLEIFWPAKDWEAVSGHCPGYNPSSYIGRLGSKTKFAIIRPDFFVYACARDASELVKCLRELRNHLD